MRTIGPRDGTAGKSTYPGLVPNTHTEAQSSTWNSTFRRPS